MEVIQDNEEINVNDQHSQENDSSVIQKYDTDSHNEPSSSSKVSDGEDDRLEDSTNELNVDNDEEKTREDNDETDEDVDSLIDIDDLDLDHLDINDPLKAEEAKRMLIEKRNKIIEFLESKGDDPEELLTLGIENDMSPSSRSQRKRQRRQSESPSYPLRERSKRNKQIKRDSPVSYEEPRYTDKKDRSKWSIDDSKLLLNILEAGTDDVYEIYKEMNQLSAIKKSIVQIRSKKSSLTQKANARGVGIIDILREEIERADGIAANRSKRQHQQQPQPQQHVVQETYSEPVYTFTSAQFEELKNVIINGILENQRQIALLRRDFAHYRGLPTPYDVAEILSEEEADPPFDHPPTTKTNKKTLVIKNKQDVNKKDNSEQKNTSE